MKIDDLLAAMDRRIAETKGGDATVVELSQQWHDRGRLVRAQDAADDTYPDSPPRIRLHRLKQELAAKYLGEPVDE